MLRRLLLISAPLLSLALIGVTVPLYLSREGVPNFTNWQRVQPGMPLERVQALLGGPGDLAELKADPASPDCAPSR